MAVHGRRRSATAVFYASRLTAHAEAGFVLKVRSLCWDGTNAQLVAVVTAVAPGAAGVELVNQHDTLAWTQSLRDDPLPRVDGC